MQSSIVNSNTYDRFVYKGDKIVQILVIKEISECKLNFVAISKNTVKGTKSRMEGIAKTLGGDYEIDEDEEGNAYPAIQYIYDKKCWLSIRIDVKNKDRLRVHASNCQDYRKKGTPFASQGIMHKVK